MVSKVLKRAPELLAPVAAAYTYRLQEYGTEARGVFWKTGEGQRLRFDVLMGVVDEADDDKGGTSVNDLGCGYGAFFEYLKDMPALRGGAYHGYDICEDMVETARRTIGDPRARFQQSLIATRRADYSFASGTFNMNLDVGVGTWEEYVRASLDHLWSMTRKGLAFNMLSIYGNKRIPDLYYADPRPFFDFCMRELSPNVTLLHDYPLQEWTLLVRR